MPFPDLSPAFAEYRSHKLVRAALIRAVAEEGCFLEGIHGSTSYRKFVVGMTARYSPRTGDFWVVYEDGHEAFSPRDAFLEGYSRTDGETEEAKPPARDNRYEALLRYRMALSAANTAARALAELGVEVLLDVTPKKTGINLPDHPHASVFRASVELS